MEKRRTNQGKDSQSWFGADPLEQEDWIDVVAMGLFRGHAAKGVLSLALAQVACGGLFGCIREGQEAHNSNRAGNNTINKEDPLPAFQTVVAGHCLTDRRHHGPCKHSSKLAGDREVGCSASEL